jgi:AraC-like DNA-binding protein
MYEQKLSSHGVKSLKVALAALAPRGASVSACVRGTGIAEADLDDPDLRIGLAQELAFYRNVLRECGDPLIGLYIGAQYRLPNYGIWGYAVRSAPDLRSALLLAFRFIRLTYTCHEVTLEEGANHTLVGLAPLDQYGKCSQIVTDRDASAMFHLMGEMLGHRLPMERISFIHRGGRHWREYRDYFGCEVEFGSRRTELHLPPAVLDCALPDSDPYIAQLTEHHCELLVANLDRHSRVTREIQRHILTRPGRFPAMEDVARAMGRSARGLRQALRDEGRSFSELVAELRYRMAREYLEVTALSMQEIAYALGYSEASNFTHAFRRWSGMSPRAYRAHHRRGP